MKNDKETSPLVTTVLKLDHYLSEISRLSEKINEIKLKSEYDYEQLQRLINNFTMCGNGVSQEVSQLSQQLFDARAQAEAAAQVVAEKAVQLQTRHNDQKQKMENFRLLGEKVRDLTLSLSDLQLPEDGGLSQEERAHLSMRLSQFQLQLEPLIDEASRIREDAHNSKLKNIEQGAESLMQQLTNIGSKLQIFQESELKSNNLQ